MIITLTTDFGLSDPYVGAMKGMILDGYPDARIVDVTHSIASHDLEEAAFCIKAVHAHFPKGTIHVVVVDPGVGSDRAILAVEAGGFIFLSPDNGVLKYIFDLYPEHRVRKVTNEALFRDTVSRTFHGRDIFAPVAAHLSKGVVLRVVGEEFKDYEKGVVRRPRIEGMTITGEIIHIDGFGSGITNIGFDLIAGKPVEVIRVNLWQFDRVMKTYSDVSRGKPLITVGSGDTLEVSVREGNAKEKMKFQIGDEVIVNLKKKDLDD